MSEGGPFDRIKKVFAKPEEGAPGGKSDDEVVQARRRFLQAAAGAGVVATGKIPQSAEVFVQSLAAAGHKLTPKAVEMLPTAVKFDLQRSLGAFVRRFAPSLKSNFPASEVLQTLRTKHLLTRDGVYDAEIIPHLHSNWNSIWNQLPKELKLQDLTDPSLIEAYKAIGTDVPPEIRENIAQAVESLQQIFNVDSTITIDELEKKYHARVLEIVKDAFRPENESLWGEGYGKVDFLAKIRENIPHTGEDGAEFFTEVRKKEVAIENVLIKESDVRLEREKIARAQQLKENVQAREKSPIRVSLKEVPRAKSDPEDVFVFKLKPELERREKMRELMDIDIFQFLQVHIPEVTPAMVEIQHMMPEVRLVSKHPLVTKSLRDLVHRVEEGEIELHFPDRVTDRPLRID